MEEKPDSMHTGESSFLDLTMCDSTITPLITWEALPFNSNSEHRSRQPDDPAPKWNATSADWEHSATTIEKGIALYEITDNVDETLANFTGVVLQGAESAIEK
ncbi:hypothetical protein JTB14_010646 [Gonioctena quinquepunctata]|nr:hypothetical protein JTB14_010646 [Gonioctena quinquepunctata]